MTFYIKDVAMWLLKCYECFSILFLVYCIAIALQSLTFFSVYYLSSRYGDEEPVTVKMTGLELN